jgi:hypothetical protein
MNEIVIKGKRYKAVFNANFKSEHAIKGGGDHYSSDIEYVAYWYFGAGIIRNLQTRKKTFVMLQTSRNEMQSKPEENYTLEESVVLFGQKDYYRTFKPKAVESRYSEIVDLSLQELILQAESSKEKIPTVTPKNLDFEMLVKKGLCYDKDGQISLGLRINV